jgi:hypothetical protein
MSLTSRFEFRKVLFVTRNSCCTSLATLHQPPSSPWVL